MNDTQKLGAALGALAFGLGAKKRLPPPPDPHGVRVDGSKGTGSVDRSRPALTSKPRTKPPAATREPAFGAGGCSCSKRKVQ